MHLLFRRGFLMNKLKVMSVAVSLPQPSLRLYLIWGLDNELDYQIIYKLLVCTWRHGGHVDGQEQKHVFPLGTKLHFHLNFLWKNCIVLTPNMATLSSDCKQRIAIRCTQSNRLLVYIEMWDKFVDRTFWEICLSFKILILPPCQQSAFLCLSEKDSAWIEENLCWGCARLKFRIQSQ